MYSPEETSTEGHDAITRNAGHTVTTKGIYGKDGDAADHDPPLDPNGRFTSLLYCSEPSRMGRPREQPPSTTALYLNWITN